MSLTITECTEKFPIFQSDHLKQRPSTKQELIRATKQSILLNP